MTEKRILTKAYYYISKAKEILDDLQKKSFYEPDEILEKEIWYSYTYIEASIALIKVAFGKEYPGISWNISPLKKREVKHLIQYAANSIKDQSIFTAEKNPDYVISKLREIRNYLRAALIVYDEKLTNLKTPQ